MDAVFPAERVLTCVCVCVCVRARALSPWVLSYTARGQLWTVTPGHLLPFLNPRSPWFSDEGVKASSRVSGPGMCVGHLANCCWPWGARFQTVAAARGVPGCSPWVWALVLGHALTCRLPAFQKPALGHHHLAAHRHPGVRAHEPGLLHHPVP